MQQPAGTLAYGPTGRWLSTIDGLGLEAAAAYWQETRQLGSLQVSIFEGGPQRVAELRGPISGELIAQLVEARSIEAREALELEAVA